MLTKLAWFQLKTRVIKPDNAHFYKGHNSEGKMFQNLQTFFVVNNLLKSNVI